MKPKKNKFLICRNSNKSIENQCAKRGEKYDDEERKSGGKTRNGDGQKWTVVKKEREMQTSLSCIMDVLNESNRNKVYSEKEEGKNPRWKQRYKKIHIHKKCLDGAKLVEAEWVVQEGIGRRRIRKGILQRATKSTIANF